MSTEIQLQLQGMHCAACAARAEQALHGMDGVREASVSAADHVAHIRLDGASLTQVSEVLSDAGYPPRTEHIELTLTGMHCAGCATRIEGTLSALDGVTEANVNFADRTAMVAGLTGPMDAASLVQAVKTAGFGASLTDTAIQSSGTDDELGSARRLALIAALLTLPVFVLEMGGHLVPAFHHWIGQNLGHTQSWLIQFVLTTLVLIGPGAVFLRRGVPDLIKGRPDMNSLVAMGSLAAWGFSTVSLFWPGLLPADSRAVYFESAAVIVTLILTGRWIEARARGQAGAAIRALAGLQPSTALVEGAGGPETRDIAEIAVGDVLHLRPGERVAVDGIIVSGQTRLDESMITGEPGTVLRQSGDWVTAGTVNGTGAVRYEAGRVGADTVLARIIAMVRLAQGGKLPIQSLADRVIARFVPAVLAIAALTAILWLTFGPTLSQGLVAAVSVLIIACPCAMGLATPVSIMVATGRAAQLGVLFRKGDALQRLEDVRVVAFDKTGTLTEGNPRLTRLHTTPDWTDQQVLRLVGAAEALSEHPIGRALHTAAREQCGTLPNATEVAAIEGLGLSAEVDGRMVLIGSARLMARESVDVTPLASENDAFLLAGQSPVFIAIDGGLRAILAVADPLKPEAEQTLRALHARGLKTALITGDVTQAAEAVGQWLGMTDIVANVLPGDKKDTVDALRAAHGPVAFVGDGINDAPALAAADVGIAMGTGTDVAIESADVILSAGRLAGVTTTLSLSQSTMRNIRQNLFWAFGYNVLLIPVAAGVLYPLTGLLLSPMLAAGAMALSSVFVVTNALRLRRFSPHKTAPTREKMDAAPVAAE